MATRQPYRTFPHRAVPSWQPLADGATASITDLGGTVIATISRRSESCAPAAGAEPMAVVVIAGDIDLDSAPLLERALMPAIAARSCTCLDMRQTGFFGAAGVHVLLAAHDRASCLGHRVVLRGVHGTTARVLAVAGLDRLLSAVD